MSIFGSAQLSEDVEADTPAVDDSPGQFGRGLRSGLYGAGSQLLAYNNALGRVAFGDEFNKTPDMFGRPDPVALEAELKRKAEEYAPRVSSYKDVHDLRSGFDYVTGLLGQSVPQSAVAIGGGLAGRTPMGRALGATLATAPLETGDVIQRLQNDPMAQQESAGERLLRAGIGGTVSAAAQSILPAIVASKVAGTAGKKTVEAAVKAGIRELPEAMALEGGTEAVGELAKQGAVMTANPDKKVDTDALLEAGIGGAAAGGAMHGVGTAGDVAHAAVRAGPDAISGAYERAKAAADSVIEGAQKKLATGQETASAVASDLGEKVDIGSPVSALKGIYEEGTQSARDFLERVAAREDVADLKGIAGKTAEQIKELMPSLDGDRVARMGEIAKGLWDNKGLDDTQREALKGAMANLQDRGAQATVAGLKLATDAGSKVRDAATSLIDRFAPKGEAKTEGVKKSEDFSGIEAELGRTVLPALMKANPGLMESDSAVAKAGQAVRFVITALQAQGKEGLSDRVRSKLHDMFGDQSENVLDAAYRFLHADVKPEEADRFYAGLNAARAGRQSDEKTLDFMRQHLDEGMKDTLKLSQLRQELEALRTWARRSDRDSEAAKFQNQQVLDELTQRYGKHAQKVLDLVEKDVRGADNALVDEAALTKTKEKTRSVKLAEETDPETGEGVQDVAELRGRTIEYTPQKGGFYPAPNTTNPHDITQQAIDRYTKANAHKAVSWVSTNELGENHPAVSTAINKRIEQLSQDGVDSHEALNIARREVLSDKHGLVLAEGSRELPGYVDRTNIDRLRVGEKTSHRDQAIRDGTLFKVGNQNFDALKVVKEMSRQHEDERTDGSSLQRRARMFFTGIAAMQDHLGESFDVPDSLVIGKLGKDANGKPVTFTVADAKGIEGKAGRGADKYIDGLRKKVERLLSTDSDAADVDALRQELKDAIYHRVGNDPRMDTERGVDEMRDADPFNDSIHELERRNAVEPLHTSPDGSARRHDGVLASERMSGANRLALKSMIDRLAKDTQSAAGKKIVERAQAVLANVDIMNKSAHRSLIGLLEKGKRPSDIASTVNALYSKYEKQFGMSKAFEPAKDPSRAESKEAASKFDPKTIDSMLAKDDYSALQTKEDTDEFLVNAAKRLVDLSKTAKRTDEQDAAYYELEGMFKVNHGAYGSSSADLGMFYSELGVAKSDDAVRAMLKKAVPEVAEFFDPKGQAGVKYSRISTDADAKALKDRAEEVKALADSLEDEAGTFAGEAIKVDKTDPAKAKELMAKYQPLQDAAHKLYSAARALESEVQTRQSYESGLARPNLTDAKKEMLGRVRAQIDEMVQEAEDKVAKALESIGRKPSAIGAGGGSVNPQQQQKIRAYIDKVLGPQVKLALAKIPHAGEYVEARDLIRISVWATNPNSTAYHEALHAFFAKLRAQGNEEVTRVLERAATSSNVQNQLKTLLANEPAALAQLRDPEEAAAYMYQFWAAKKLTIGPAEKTLFTKIKEAVAKVLGIWTSDQRAQQILDYFHSGEFKTTGMGQPSAVAKALLEPGKNAALEWVKDIAKPVLDVAEAMSVAGGQRLRDTGIPALRELADMMKATGRDRSNAPGFVPSARAERTRWLNEFAGQMRGIPQAAVDEALQAMQTGKKAGISAEALKVVDIIQGPQGLLPRMLKYMEKAGVDVHKIHASPTYFPRKYDADYVSRHLDEFTQLLETHGYTTKEATRIAQQIAATDGAEFTIETDVPGMQHLKHRAIVGVPEVELARFMSKDLYEIIGSYVTQATRRGEWARLFTDDGKVIVDMMNEAQRQGATPEQIKTGWNFVRAVDGTLGDDRIDPKWRRIQGNIAVYQNIRLLPLAIFSSVVDPLGIAVRGGTAKDAFSAFVRGWKDLRHAWADEYPADADAKLAEQIGTIDDAMLQHTMAALYTQGMVGDTAKKINDTFFKYNLMEGFNRSMRVGATKAAIAFLERHADGKASKHSERWLAELGLKPGEYDGDLTNPKIRAAINMWVDGAVLRPDSVDKPIWMNDPRFMLVAHLKQFTYSFQETILKRVAHEYQQGNYKPAMALVSYVPVMIAADLLKDMIRGGGELPEWKKGWGPAQYVASGVQRAGITGAAQIGLDGVGMIGPSAEQVVDAAVALKSGKGIGREIERALPANALYEAVAPNVD